MRKGSDVRTPSIEAAIWIEAGWSRYNLPKRLNPKPQARVGLGLGGLLKLGFRVQGFRVYLWLYKGDVRIKSNNN